MRKRTVVFGLGTLMAMVVSACGGGGGGGGTLASGVERSKQSDEITQDEAVQICEAVGDYAEARYGSLDYCRVYGVATALEYAGNRNLTEADLQDVCAEAEEYCHGEGLEIPFFDRSALRCDEIEPPSDCPVTVGEVERCYQDLIDQEYRILAVRPCGQVTHSYLESFLDQLERLSTTVPRTCERMETECTDF